MGVKNSDMINQKPLWAIGLTCQFSACEVNDWTPAYVVAFQILSSSTKHVFLKYKDCKVQLHTPHYHFIKMYFHVQINVPSSSTLKRLRFLSPSTADTDWLLGILDFFEGDTVTWLKRFLLTFVTSVNKHENNRLQISANFTRGHDESNEASSDLELLAFEVVVALQQVFLLEHTALALSVDPKRGKLIFLQLWLYFNHKGFEG